MQLFLACLSLLCASCLFHPRNGIDGYKYALRHGAPFKVRLRVVTPEGEPVKGAVVRLDNTTALSAFGAFRDRHQKTEHVTDSNGECVLSGSTVGEYWFTIHKDGFYRHKEDVWLRRSLPKEECVRDGRWQPYDAVKEIVFKPIRTPIPMYYCGPSDCYFAVPEFPVGLRFESNQFVRNWKPGIPADVVFNAVFTNDCPPEIALQDGESCVKWTISFPNPNDGVCERPATPYSALQSDYRADPHWDYANQRTFYMVYRRMGGKFFAKQFRPLARITDEKRYYVMRIRTEVDSAGKVLRANYAKFYILNMVPHPPYNNYYGVTRVGGQTLMSAFFFNPIPNDTNLECDRDRQLGAWKSMDDLSDYWH